MTTFLTEARSRGRDRLEVLRPNLVLVLCRRPFSGHARVDNDARVDAPKALAGRR